jgi:hypothetical protein
MTQTLRPMDLSVALETVAPITAPVEDVTGVESPELGAGAGALSTSAPIPGSPSLVHAENGAVAVTVPPLQAPDEPPS